METNERLASLTTNKKAIDQYENNCIEYVNDKIKESNKDYDTEAELRKNCIFPELLQALRLQYRILEESDDYLTISWNKENQK